MLLSGDTQVPLDDRPWELFENLTPDHPTIRHVNMFLSTRPIRDTASIPMSLFEPQLKRDAIPRDGGEWESSGAERNLGDGLTGEPLAAKQASTLLYASPALEETTASATATTTQPTTPATAKSDPPSPLSSITARRPSTRKAGAGTSSKDAIAVEEESSDSDLEVVEAPPTKRPRVGSKSTARPAMGGKAPAKRTTGGKSVGRKATGGKNVGRKGMGGKAPRKR